MLIVIGLELLINMVCPLCKSNDIKELEINTETIKSFSKIYESSYDINLYFCMDCNNIFGKKS